MPERRDDLHADRPPVGMRLAGNADAWQPRGVHPGAKHPLRCRCETGRRFVLGPPCRRSGGGDNQRVVLSPRGGHISPPGSERVQRVNICGGRNRKTTFSGSPNVLACLGTPAIRESDHHPSCCRRGQHGVKGAQSAEVEGGGYRGDLTIRAGKTANCGGDAGRDLWRRAFITDRSEPADPETTVGRDVRSGRKP